MVFCIYKVFSNVELYVCCWDLNLWLPILEVSALPLSYTLAIIIEFHGPLWDLVLELGQDRLRETKESSRKLGSSYGFSCPPFS